MSEIRPISQSDIGPLIQMMIAMRLESPSLAASVTVDVERTWANIKTMIDNETLVGVIADGGCMLGIIGPNWYSSRVEAFEQMLYVKPEKRGTMLGIRLIGMFENIAIERGAAAVHVGSSTGISDERTARLYERKGYSRSGISLSKEF